MSVETRAVLPEPEDLARTLTRDLAWLGEGLGSAVIESLPVSPLRGVARPRTAFRVTLADGRCVKLRRLKTAARAAELARLLERLADRGLPQPLLLRGETLVVEWLAGTPLPPAQAVCAPDRVRAAGLLAAIHGTPCVRAERQRAPSAVAAELRGLEAQLEVLVASGACEAAEASEIAADARRWAPRESPVGVAHGDFSAENLIVDPQGRLRVVDNEALAVGLLDLDLARTWSRWPMPEASWRAFLGAYEAFSGRRIDDSALGCWKLRTLVLSAWYRTRYELSGVPEVLARLRILHASLVAGASGSL